MTLNQFFCFPFILIFLALPCLGNPGNDPDDTASSALPSEKPQIVSKKRHDSGTIEVYQNESLAAFVSYSGCSIDRLHTSEQFRKRGYAKIAMRAALSALEHCQCVTLYALPCEEGVDPARLRAFYRKFGFAPDWYNSLELFFHSDRKGCQLYYERPATHSSQWDWFSP
jgi:GNAT superfamily N-acetyltransferase